VGLYRYDGKLLVRGNALATSSDCCCGGDSCLECALRCTFPEGQSVTIDRPGTGQCEAFPLVYEGVAREFQGQTAFPVWGAERAPPTFKPGMQGKLGAETCPWVFCEDFRYRAWCCPIPTQSGGTLGSVDYQWRFRILFIVCPEDGEPYVEDRSDEYLAFTHFQELLGPETGWWGECLSPPEKGPYPDWFPDPEPVCNEFP
jgi:hypothetical protein